MTRHRPTPLPQKRRYRPYQCTGLRAIAKTYDVSYASMRRLIDRGTDTADAIRHCQEHGLIYLSNQRPGYTRHALL